MTDTINSTSVINKVVIIDDDKNTQLHYSCASGKEESVLKDLETHHKIDVENYLGWTPLMMACRNGYLDIVKILLDRRADATKRNKFGMNVFLISVGSENLKLVNLILQHLLSGGVSKLSLQKVFSPISLSILFSNEELLKYLIDQSFNINQPTPVTGLTPFMFAAALPSSQSMKLLRKYGANEAIKNCCGVSAKDMIDERKRAKEQRKLKDALTVSQTQQATVNQPQFAASQNQQSHHLHPHNIPMIMIGPHGSYYNVSPNQTGPMRKSSDTHTPSYFMPPNVTPITPVGYMPQVFFPPDFSQNQMMSPLVNFNMYNNDFLNQRIYSNAAFMSPMYHPDMHYDTSPCV